MLQSLTFTLTLLSLLSAAPAVPARHTATSFTVYETDNHALSRHRRHTHNNHTSSDVGYGPLRSLVYDSTVRSRFARSTVAAEARNTLSNQSRSFTFRVDIPQLAFISAFRMRVANRTFAGRVYARDEAQRLYAQARSRNSTAALVTADETRERVARRPEPAGRGLQRFTVSASLPPLSDALFTLEYAQLLHRRLGLYEHVTSVRPGQVVERLEATVRLREPQHVRLLRAAAPNDSATEMTQTGPGETVVRYQPSVAEQTRVQALSGEGVRGILTVSYDVTHVQRDLGTVITDGRHFAHYFSPSDETISMTQLLRKRVVFVIDVSGSMSGLKMAQTRVAMDIIVQQLRPTDDFTLLLFDDQLRVWSERPLPANSEVVSRARSYLNTELVARGSTDINAALVRARALLAASRRADRSHSPYVDLVVFLTDGQASSGVTSTAAIVENVVGAGSEAAIFSLGFGRGVNIALLEQLSARSGGTVRKISEELDAGYQLTSFFDEIGAPLLRALRFGYPAQAVVTDSVTQTEYLQYFNGSELVICGRMRDDYSPLDDSATVTMTAVDVSGYVSLNKPFSYSDPTSSQAVYPTGLLEQLWAYQRVNSLLRDRYLTPDLDARALIEERALNMSLRYQFVTPLTSMVVVNNREFLDTSADENSVLRGIFFSRSSSASGEKVGVVKIIHLFTAIMIVFAI